MRACVRACVKAFSVTVLRGSASQKTTISNTHCAEDFKISNKKQAKKLLPVLELACAVYQTYFLTSTAHTDNWYTELPESVIVEKPWAIILAKISHAAETVLCTRHEQAMQDSS
jgi:hypothetical protein